MTTTPTRQRAARGGAACRTRPRTAPRPPRWAAAPRPKRRGPRTRRLGTCVSGAPAAAGCGMTVTPSASIVRPSSARCSALAASGKTSASWRPSALLTAHGGSRSQRNSTVRMTMRIVCSRTRTRRATRRRQRRKRSQRTWRRSTRGAGPSSVASGTCSQTSTARRGTSCWSTRSSPSSRAGSTGTPRRRGRASRSPSCCWCCSACTCCSCW
mmetsp:Transcript_14206/g.44173  ORF Transcript_14206/g.44173 Transcript_14206/m.44173 type:complete len:212 (+) Transcript_14206:4279-4914(+)